MIRVILSDFSRVILQVKDKTYKGTLNGLYQELVAKNKTFNFYDYYEFNEELLTFYKKLKRNYSVNIFTLGSIQKNSAEVKKRIRNIFDNVFSSKDLGLNKNDSRSYILIAKKLHKKPEEILFIDDQEENIKAAKKMGLKTVLFENTHMLLSKLKILLDLATPIN